MPLPRKIVLHRLTGRRRPVGALVGAAVALVAAALGVSSPAAAQTQPFTDISQDAYYSEAVGALAGNGIFDGTECAQGMLCPGEPIDRKTMAVWTVRALDGQDPAETADSRFSDVDAGSFHGPFIERMADLGVTTGCGDGTGFCPDGTVTRNQMAVFLTRAFDLDPGPDPGFSDVAADAWYYDHVAALAASNITAGCGDGTRFCPRRHTTRAQMATFLARATGLVELPTSTPDSSSTFPVTVILTNTIVAVDHEGKRHITTADFTNPDGSLRVFVSPDGNRIAYTTDTALYVTDPDGSNTQRIAEGEFIRRNPFNQVVTARIHPTVVWSPDSSRIAYTIGASLFTTTLDDGKTIQLARSNRPGSPHQPLKWSPDSSRIAYITWIGSTNQGSSLFTLLIQNADGANRREVASGIRLPSVEWSPDGSRFAYLTSQALFVSNADGTDANEVYDNYEWDEYDRHVSSASMSWSPDNSHIVVFVRGPSYTHYTYRIVNSEGTGVQDFLIYIDDQSTYYEPHLESVALSLDGTQIAYISVAGPLFVSNIDGSGSQMFPNEFSTSLSEIAAWSPDGRHIIAEKREWGPDRVRRTTGLVVFHADPEYISSHPESVLRFDAAGSAVFSPSGTELAYLGANGVTMMDLSNGEMDLLMDYSDIISDLGAQSGVEFHVCDGRLQWTPSGVRGTAQLCRTLSAATEAPSGTYKYITAGSAHSCAIRTDNTITCWGTHYSGIAPLPAGYISAAIDAPAGTYKAISTGLNHSCAIRTDDTITCWGDNQRRQAEPPSGTYKAIDAGWRHSCAIRTDDTITCWGHLGVTGVQAEAPSGTYKAIGAGGLCAIRTDDTITCWFGSAGEVVAAYAPAGTYKAISANSACAIRTDDAVVCWNTGGGSGVRVDTPSGTYKAVAAGGNHSCAIGTDDTITCWRYNRRATAPTGTYKAVAAGGNHSCAIRTDDTITCWEDDG